MVQPEWGEECSPAIEFCKLGVQSPRDWILGEPQDCNIATMQFPASRIHAVLVAAVERSRGSPVGVLDPCAHVGTCMLSTHSWAAQYDLQDERECKLAGSRLPCQERMMMMMMMHIIDLWFKLPRNSSAAHVLPSHPM